jgi:hypothetical protein
MYNIEMSDHDIIWASLGGNSDFGPFFAVNKLLSIKLKANPLCVLSRNSIFF